MSLTNERVRKLLEPSVPAGESLSHVAVGLVPTPVLRMLAALFLPSIILVIILVAAHVNMKSPVASGGLIAGVVALMALGYFGFLTRRRNVVGITNNRLLVGELGDRSGTRVAKVHDYPLAKIKNAKRRTLHRGAAGTVTAFRLELADPIHPFRVDFLPELMTDNEQESRPICDAVTSASRAEAA